MKTLEYAIGTNCRVHQSLTVKFRQFSLRELPEALNINIVSYQSQESFLGSSPILGIKIVIQSLKNGSLCFHQLLLFCFAKLDSTETNRDDLKLLADPQRGDVILSLLNRRLSRTA